MSDTYPATIAAIRAGLAQGEFTARALAGHYYERIAATEAPAAPAANAWLTLCRERAEVQADRVDALARQGQPLPPLAGLPLAVKDVISMRGVRTTCGSRMLEHYIAPYDATVIEKLEAAGALLLGKVNCDEFAMGSSTENSAFGPTRNPRDPSRVPGGSSGGSAAVVANGSALAALGSDTGGSIRQPAAFCGVVGLLPTYGRVSRYGLVAFGSSLDHIGPLTRSVDDAARLLGVLAGPDPRDATCADVPVPDYAAQLAALPAGFRIGVVKEAWGGGLDSQVEATVRRALDRLAGAGCDIVEVSLPHLHASIATYYIVATAEASANLARFDGVRYGLRAEAESLGEMYRKTREAGFGAEVKRRILLGTYVLSSGYYDAYYRKAQLARALLARDLDRAFAQADLLVTPTTPGTAFKIGERISNPLEMYLADIYTVPADLAGIPAISVPCGEAAGLPVGLQFMGRHFDETRVLQAARLWESLSEKSDATRM